MKVLRSLVVLAVACASLPSSASAPQNDAGTGADAGNTFATATVLATHGHYDARLDKAAGDTDDYYGFDLTEGQSFSVLVAVDATTSDVVEMLDPNGVVVDSGMRAESLGIALSNAFTAASIAFSPSSEVSQVRVTVQRAVFAGEYRLHVQSNRFAIGAYSLCVMNCDEPVKAPQDIIFGGSLKNLETKVLLVPPAHGDLGNPLGPTVLDYIEATRRGIHRWSRAIDEFTADHPEYSYLRRVKIEIELFDGAHPVDPAGYDVIIGYIAAGPAFRGVADDSGTGDLFESLGLGQVHYSGRVILLSLFGSSPRAGQVAYDFPEVNDLENVTLHEFGHTFGLGHTRTWSPVYGPDEMNSPYAFVYGDGAPAGDGGERTPLKCLSSLNLYGLAELYSWVPEGRWEPSFGSVTLPETIPYTWYC
jgi:hypothetical protein